MPVMPRYAILAAGGAILLCAASGTYLGIARSLGAASAGGEEAVVNAAPVTPVASAKPMLTPAMDEGQVREIAREEAQAVLAKNQVRRAPKAEDVDEDADTETPQLTPAQPTNPVQAPQKPAAPPAAAPASIPF